MNELIKNKFKAFAVHFGISALVIAIYSAMVLFGWYPHPFSVIEGVWEVMIILVVVDVILGPMLTFIVFKPGKASLKFDLSVIVLLQILAFSWGVNITYTQRPLYVVFAYDTYHLIPATEVNTDNITDDSLRAGWLSGPKIVFLQPPENKDERQKFHMMMRMPGSESVVAERSDLYRPQKDHLSEINKESVDLSPRTEDFLDIKLAVEDFLAKHKTDLAAFTYIPVAGRKNMVMGAFDKDTGEIIDIVY